MGTFTLWIAFNAGVALLLLVDLGMFHRRAHTISLREAAMESAVWIALSGAFGLWVFLTRGPAPGLEFFTGYVIEASLSLDNVFIFILIFQYFRVDPQYQHRLLFWGVLGALLLRGTMIGTGIALLNRFQWIMYVFGVFLVYSGIKLLTAEHAIHPDTNPALRWIQKRLPMTSQDAGQHLFVREGGRWLATRLLLVVIVLEVTDLIFATDSIPAIFGVTRDPFIVYTSNVCAILGLRAFYFLVGGMLPYFRFLDEGLALVLVFIGAKMLADPWIRISIGVSLSIVGCMLGASILISVWAEYRDPRKSASSSKMS